jgi:FkbM family methyltransferase
MTYLSPLERILLFYGLRFPNHPRKWWLHSRLRRWMQVRLDREFEVVRGGLTWSLNPADFADEALFWLGAKDTWDVEHLKRLVSPGDVILDVGANFGYYGLTLAETLQGDCLVHALEPDPVNFDRLCRHIKCNDVGRSVRAHELGVSNGEGPAKLDRHPGNSGHSAVAAYGEVNGVRLTTLDDFCSSLKLDRIDIVILDVEGLEERALQGAKQTLKRLRPLVFIELFPPVMARQDSSPEAAVRILAERGYKLFVARRNSLVPLAALPTGDCRCNVFAFHYEKLPKSLRINT